MMQPIRRCTGLAALAREVHEPPCDSPLVQLQKCGMLNWPMRCGTGCLGVAICS
jgi:hypothetical protein